MADLGMESAVTVETVERALKGYMECAVWSSTLTDGEPMDSEYTADDLSFGSVENMRDDVYAFLCSTFDAGLDLSPIEPEQIGHDFWLTRNHHGAGFWDRGLGELGDRLTELAHACGEAYLWDGEDGRLYYAV